MSTKTTFDICLGPVAAKDVGTIIELITGIAPLKSVTANALGPQHVVKAGSAFIGKGKAMTKAEIDSIKALYDGGATIKQIVARSKRSRQSVLRVLQGQRG